MAQRGLSISEDVYRELKELRDGLGTRSEGHVSFSDAIDVLMKYSWLMFASNETPDSEVDAEKSRHELLDSFKKLFYAYENGSPEESDAALMDFLRFILYYLTGLTAITEAMFDDVSDLKKLVKQNE